VRWEYRPGVACLRRAVVCFSHAAISSGLVQGIARAAAFFRSYDSGTLSISSASAGVCSCGAFIWAAARADSWADPGNCWQHKTLARILQAF
jgi:hypothetical protein